MLKPTLCYSLEKMINFVLMRDATSIERLAALEDKIILLEFTDLHLKFYWLFENQQVRILSNWRDQVDTNIAGPLEAIARLGLSKARIAKDLTVSGDMRVLEAFKELFAKLEINWQQQLAPLVGDMAAFKLTQTAQSLGSWFKSSMQSMQENTKEYLTEESEYLPPRLLFTDFTQEVRKLSRATERLAMRIQRLQARGL